MTDITNWIQDHAASLTWMLIISVVIFGACVLAAPLILRKMPADYFTHDTKPPSLFGGSGDQSKGTSPWKIARNVAGWIMVVAGLAMLVLPGPGLVMSFIGLLLVDFPGKYTFEKWLVKRAKIMGVLNWIRKEAGAGPFDPPKQSGQALPAGS